MNTPDDFSQYYADLLEGVYDRVDRIVLNAFFSMGQTRGGMRSWWRKLHVDDSQLDDKHLREMAGTFSRRLHAFCAKHGIPIIEAHRLCLPILGVSVGVQSQSPVLALIDQTRAPLDLKQLKTIFGFSHRPHRSAKRGRPADQVVKAVEAQSYDLTVFRVKWGNLTLKIYDKGGRVLRIEVVAHNVKELRSGKVLDKLPQLLKRMREMLVRFLGNVQAAHVAFLDEGAFERWSKPTQRGAGDWRALISIKLATVTC